MYLKEQQDALDKLLGTYVQWGWSDLSLREICSFNTVSFGDFGDDFVSFNHHTHQAGTDYVTVTCASKCGCRWACDASITDEGWEITAISVSESWAVMEMVEFAINKMGLAAFGKHWKAWPEQPVASPVA